MTDFITLTCPSCGGKLHITSGIDHIACEYCGTEQIIRGGSEIVTLVPVKQDIKQVPAGMDRTASELAIRRLKEDLKDLRKQRQSILNDPKYQTSNGDNFLATLGQIIIGLAVTAVIFSLFLLSSNLFLGLLFIVSCVGLILLGVFVGRYGVNKKKKKDSEVTNLKMMMISSLDTQITPKEVELKHHEEIVSIFK